MFCEDKVETKYRLTFPSKIGDCNSFDLYEDRFTGFDENLLV